ncbi:hypothetical protein [Lentzea sp. NPDC055074]
MILVLVTCVVVALPVLIAVCGSVMPQSAHRRRDALRALELLMKKPRNKQRQLD